MTLLIRYWRGAVLWALAAFTGLTLGAQWRGRERTAAVLLDAREVRALCSAEGYPESSFWERARAMGVAGVLLRPVTLGEHLASGEVLRFGPEEIEKLKATGVAARDAPLKAGALWVRDPRLVRALEESADAHGVDLYSERHGRMHVVELKGIERPDAFPVGYDLDAHRPIAGKGLIPVYFVRSGPELALALSHEAPAGLGTVADKAGGGGAAPAAFLVGPGYEHPATGSLSELRERLGHRRGWLLLADGSAEGLGSLSPARRARLLPGLGLSRSRILAAGELAPDAGLAGALAQAEAGRPVMLARLPEKGLEAGLDGLRLVLRSLRERGFAPRFPESLHEARPVEREERWARLALALILTAAGPILAVRTAVRALRRFLGRVPEAAPFLEAAAGLGAAFVVQAGAGLAVHALRDFPAWRLGAGSPWWGAAGEGAALAAAFAALYFPRPREFLDQVRSPGGGRALASAALAAAAAALLWQGWPGDPQDWLGPFAARRPDLWWVPGRWREWLVGWPCLFAGLCLLVRRLSAAPGEVPSPRGWLLAGMLAPVGMAGHLGGAGVPFDAALAQAAWCVLAGAPAGLLILVLAGLTRKT